MELRARERASRLAGVNIKGPGSRAPELPTGRRSSASPDSESPDQALPTPDGIGGDDAGNEQGPFFSTRVSISLA